MSKNRSGQRRKPRDRGRSGPRSPNGRLWGNLPGWIQVPINNDRVMIRIELLGRLSLCLDSSSRTCALALANRSRRGFEDASAAQPTRPLDDRKRKGAPWGRRSSTSRAVSPYEVKVTPQQCAALMTRRLQDDEQFRQWEVKWMGALYATLGHLMDLAVQSSLNRSENDVKPLASAEGMAISGGL